MGYIMGIDLGTSSVKVLITDDAGLTKGMGQTGYEIDTPEIGYAEQSPGVWWKCTKEAIADALYHSGILAEELDGVGFSGQMHGLVALDRERNVIGKALIHLDQRSIEEKELIYCQAGNLLTEELLNQPGTGMLITSLMWLKIHKPDVYDRIDVVMSPKDYIRYKLTGDICSDYSDASATLAFSVKNNCWCDELLERLQVKKDIWPKVRSSSEVIGTISEAAAKETGLSVRTKVVVGAGDCAAQMVGNAVAESGTVACNIGTASQLAVIVKQPLFDPKLQCQLWCHSIRDTWMLQGGAMNGGNTLSWLRNKVLKNTIPFAQLDLEASRIPAGSEGLVFLPYLAGERTPYNNAMARGVYFGLGLKHEQAHLVRATMEGVMYNLCECKKIFDELGISQKKLISSGGAAKGLAWKQIQADMLGMPVHTTQTEEEACLGAAIMAAVGIGMYRDIPEACKAIVKLSPEVTDPIAENVRYYREKQEVFHDLYGKVEDLYPRLS